jgi:hypothetical protein
MQHVASSAGRACQSPFGGNSSDGWQRGEAKLQNYEQTVQRHKAPYHYDLPLSTMYSIKSIG